MNAEKIYYGAILFCLIIGAATSFIMIKIEERKDRKYEKELLRRATISFLETRLKGKTKELAISDFNELKKMEEKLIKIQESYNDSLKYKPKEFLKSTLIQEANNVYKFSKRLKNEYRFVLNKAGKQYLDEQMRFGKKIASCK